MDTLKERLRRGEALIGPLVTLPSPDVSELIARLGFDYVWIEVEHASTGFERAQQMVQAVGGRCPTLVRVPENAEVWFKKALDTGCDGVVVPQIREASDVEAAVRWCMYPPDGARSVGLARAHGYGLTFQDYVDSANDRVAIVVMVEHIDAVESIEAICRVPGLDAVLVGPFDLSGSMGIPGQVGHQRVSAAIDQVRTACQRAGLPVGMFCADAATAEAALDRGFRLIALATDTLFLSRGAQRSLKQVRRAVER